MDFYVYVYFRVDGTPCYVGKGKDYRWSAHARFSHNRYLKNLLQKHGRAMPRVKIAQGVSEERAFEIEKALIAVLGRISEGGCLVNMTLGGEGTTGRQAVSGADHPNFGKSLSEETKRKIGAANRGKTRSEDQKAKLRGRPRTEEHARKISEAKRGIAPTAETRLKISIAGMGRGKGIPLSDEHRARISAAKAGKKQPLDSVARRAQANRGKRHSAETKAAISAARKGKALSPEHVEKLKRCHVGTRGCKWTAETKEKMRQSHLKRWADKRTAEHA